MGPAGGAPRGLMVQRKCACGGTCEGCRRNSELPIGPADDHHEREADQTVAQVMGMPGSSAATLQRKRAQCGEEGGENSRKVRRQETGAGPDLAPPIVHEVLRAPGQPLDPVARNFMEPRFGQNFSGVRIHANAKAADSARAVGALAYTYGDNIVFGSRQYAPESHTGRRLLAHELTHVIQQNHGSGVNRAIQRAGTPSSLPQTAAAAPTQTIAPSCAGQQADINAAWSRAVEILDCTISRLDAMVTLMSEEGGPRRFMPRQTMCVVTSFGDVGGLDGGGGFTELKVVIENFRRIQAGFTGGKNLRCDPNTVANNECGWRSAFVVVGNSRDIFLCPNFFSPDVNVVSRAVTLIHEMAHSVLRISHQGIPENTYPETFFNYNSPLGLEFDDARRNAFAYEILANCLCGEPPTPTEAVAGPSARTAAARTEPRGSLSLMGGAGLTPAIQGLAGVAGRLSLRPGALVIFNPYIGVNVLYSPTTTAQPAGFFTGLAEAGLRIQQPTRGAYLDLAGGAFVGFEAPLAAPLAAPLRTTAGLSAGAGAGWRWERVELGVEAIGLLPLTQGDPNRVVVLGRVGIRFGK